MTRKKFFSAAAVALLLMSLSGCTEQKSVQVNTAGQEGLSILDGRIVDSKHNTEGQGASTVPVALVQTGSGEAQILQTLPVESAGTQAAAPSTRDKIAQAVAVLKAKYGKSEEPIKAEIIDGIEELMKGKKAIYSGARDGMLFVQWIDLVVIYDFEAKSVVKEIGVSSIALG